MLSRFRWYRRWCGGRWVAITPTNWMMVPPECDSRIDEDWRTTEEIRIETLNRISERNIRLSRKLEATLAAMRESGPGAK